MSGPIAYYQVRHRPVDSDGEWVEQNVSASSPSVTITGVDPSKTYVIQARSVGPTGLKSIWVDISHTVEGNVVPEVPGGLTAEGVADGVRLAWSFVNPMPADIEVCVERGTAVGGPFTEVLQVRATRVIVSEVVDGTFYYRVRTKNFRDEYSDYSTVVSGNPATVAELNANIATALTTAQNAQAAADGKIVTFWQASPPVIGAGAGQAKVGDIWFDTDDGNKIYRVVGAAWVVAADDDMAQAIAAASNAQATADGKVTTFYQAGAPTATALGDLWFNTTTKKLFRWNGSSWTSEIADITLEQLSGSGVNIMPAEYSLFEQTDAPTTVRNAAIVTAVPVLDATAVALGQPMLKWTSTGNDGYIYFNTNSTSNYNIPITPGKKWLVSFWMKSTVAAPLVNVYLRRNDSGLHSLGNVSGPSVANTIERVVTLIDLTSFSDTTAAILRMDLDVAGSIWVGGIQIEEQIGNRTTPSAYSRGPSVSLAISALTAAGLAQDTADGKIESYFQPTMPSGASLGDLWFDTDDKNKQYRHNGTTFVVAQDSAIGDAITAAAGAQATADGKVTTFFTDSTPTATAVGDLWCTLTTKTTSRWNGSTWVTMFQDSSDDLFTVNGNFSRGFQGWAIAAGSSALSTDSDSDGYFLRQNGTAASSDLNQSKYIPVAPGQRYKLSSMFERAGTTPDGTVGYTVRTYDSAKAQVAYTGIKVWDNTEITTFNPTKFEFIYTVPSGVYWVRFGLYFRSRTTGSYYVREFDINRLPDTIEDMPVGPTYSYVDNQDVYVSGTRRIGLRVGTSGQRLGNQRNIPRSNTSAYTMVRTTTALSATSAGAVSVNAHTARYGGYSVAYSAVANAVTGLTVGTTYVIYCVDANLTGGVKTYFAGTNPEAVMNISDDIYVVGQITIPSSGSSSGGSGSGGTDPGDWCVVADQLVLEETQGWITAGEIHAGDRILCWNDDVDDPSSKWVDVESNEVNMAPAMRILTARSEVSASTSTPMPTRDGGLEYIVGVREVLERDEIGVCWTKVIKREDLGERLVAHIRVSQHCYFAGVDAKYSIATHNPTYKP